MKPKEIGENGMRIAMKIITNEKNMCRKARKIKG